MLILASQSPRRQDLLRNAGIGFTVRPSSVPEVPGDGEPPEEYVCRLARQKALAAVRDPSDVVLGADTEVVIDGAVLGKPSDAQDAARMMRLLSGRDHLVITGICVVSGGDALVDLARTIVRFKPLTEAEIEAYVASGEPMDKAGAYGIQGLASKFVERIEGCHFNIVGLPVSLVYGHLLRRGLLDEGKPCSYNEIDEREAQ